MSNATGTLTFTETMSITAYAEANNIESLDFVRNKETNKLFGSFDNGTTCALARSLDKAKPMVISNCIDEATGESFLMIHNRSESNVEDSFTF